MALKLYGLPMSTCTTRVMICLGEKGVDDFELVPVNLFAGEHKQPSHLARNPFGKIPVLEDGDLTLFESRAMTAYIAEKYKNTGTDLLRHGDLKEAAMVRVWVEVEAQEYSPAISALVYQLKIAPKYGKETDQKIVNENTEKLGKILDVYEEQLSKTEYLAGNFFSLADLHNFPYTHYLMTTPAAKLVNERPHVKAWWERISARPAFKKVSENMTFG